MAMIACAERSVPVSWAMRRTKGRETACQEDAPWSVWVSLVNEGAPPQQSGAIIICHHRDSGRRPTRVCVTRPPGVATGVSLVHTHFTGEILGSSRTPLPQAPETSAQRHLLRAAQSAQNAFPEFLTGRHASRLGTAVC